jgi:hypothetical protein
LRYGKFEPFSSRSNPSITISLRNTFNESDAHCISSLETSSSHSTIAYCVPHVLKLVLLSSSLLMVDQEFSIDDDKLLD